MYSNHYFSREDKLNKFCDITEKLPIKQDAKLLAGIFTEKYEYILSSNRNYYLYVVNGTANINNIESKEGDGYSFENETKLLIESKECEIILFELK
jgi:redox-sensitive bicupin YhaK (pirin superfamily)